MSVSNYSTKRHLTDRKAFDWNGRDDLYFASDCLWLINRPEPLGADDLPVFEIGRGLLKAVGARSAQAFVGNELAAFLVAVVAIHESVFFRFPVEALELIRIVALALLAQHALHVIRDARCDHDCV
jgi:hypothetical protein